MTDHIGNAMAKVADAIATELDDALADTESVYTGWHVAPIRKITTPISTTRDQLIDFGTVEPTAEERREREEATRAREVEASARFAKTEAEHAELCERVKYYAYPWLAILDLHRPVRTFGGHAECHGCGSLEDEDGEWFVSYDECKTVALIRAHLVEQSG